MAKVIDKTVVVVISGYGKVGAYLLDAALNDPDVDVQAIVEKKGHPLVGTNQKDVSVIDDIDLAGEAGVLIEFSTPDAVAEHVFWAKKNQVAMLVATTGLSDGQKATLKEAASEIPVLLASNVTLGMNILFNEVPKIAKILLPAGWMVDITETHRKAKVDKPSGTAKTLAEGIKLVTGQEVGEENIHSIRAGNVVGIHEIKFFGPSGEKLYLIHEVPSREDFALAAINLAKMLSDLSPGFYSATDLVLQKL